MNATLKHLYFQIKKFISDTDRENVKGGIIKETNCPYGMRVLLMEKGVNPIFRDFHEKPLIEKQARNFNYAGKTRGKSGDFVMAVSSFAEANHRSVFPRNFKRELFVFMSRSLHRRVQEPVFPRGKSF